MESYKQKRTATNLLFSRPPEKEEEEYVKANAEKRPTVAE